MSIRQIDGKTVLSYFNASTGNMEVRVANDPTGLGTAPVTTVVVADATGRIRSNTCRRRRTTRLAQPYGGYISPGFDARRAARVRQPVEHRRRARGRPYRVIQFAVNPFKP